MTAEQEEKRLEKVRELGRKIAELFPKMHGSVKVLIKNGHYAGFKLEQVVR